MIRAMLVFVVITVLTAAPVFMTASPRAKGAWACASFAFGSTAMYFLAHAVMERCAPAEPHETYESHFAANPRPAPRPTTPNRGEPRTPRKAA